MSSLLNLKLRCTFANNFPNRAHPFLPTSTQGASQAVEDGATIAMCLAKGGKGNVPLALRAYFDLRYEHVKAAQQVGITQRDKWHNLHDKKTMKMKKELDTSKGMLDSYHLWIHDCEQVVEDGWEEASARVHANMAKQEVPISNGQ